MILLPIFLTLLLVVGVHELGHALAAKCFKVKVLSISLGFGPEVYSWTSKKHVKWVVAMFPIGGFVKLLNSRIHTVNKKDQAYCFNTKPIYARIIILFAGALANILLAFAALTLTYSLGYEVTSPKIASVTPDSLAARAGLHQADTLTQIGQTPITSWQEASMAIISNLGATQVPIAFTDENNHTHTSTIDLGAWQYTSGKHALLKGLGMTPSTKARHDIPGVSLKHAARHALNQIGTFLLFFGMVIKQLATGSIPFAILLGPIGILQAMSHNFVQGLSLYAYFIGTFSLAIAVANLLPIPGLDGGSILYCLLEGVRGKPISVALEVLLHRLAFIALCVFLVQLALNDIQKMFINYT